jgi:hypothetical protein
MSMRGTLTNTVSPEARARIVADLGDNPTVIVDDLKGDGSKGEKVTNGYFDVADEVHPDFAGVINNRVVKVGDMVVFGPVLVTPADVLTHAKAAATLRSFASAGGFTVRAPRDTKAPAAVRDEPESEYDRRARLVREAVASFPAVFKLRAFPNDLFQVHPGESYWSELNGGEVLVYTFVLRETGWTAFAKGTPAELRGQLVHADDEAKDRVVDFYLDELDNWRAGKKASPGCPADGERYAGRMQDAVKRIAGQLRALGCKVDDQGNVIDEEAPVDNLTRALDLDAFKHGAPLDPGDDPAPWPPIK